MHGENVTLFIFGESVSVGADLGKHNNEKVFHNILGYWWDSVFSEITNSKMIRRNLAIGGVGTAYFGRCWQEYLKPSDSFDLAIWEFNINDVGDRTLLASLELFTQSLYKRFKKLDLVFTVFFRRTLFDDQHNINSKNFKRHELAENIVAKHAHHYNLTCFNIEPLLNHSKIHLGVADMFKNIHPSALAHTEMAFLMIEYYTDIMISTLNTWLTQSRPKMSTMKLQLPNSLTMGNKTCQQEICWTAVTPNFYQHIQKHNLFQLPVTLSKEFVKITSGWQHVPEKRYDITGGYRASKKGGRVSIYFNVTKSKNQDNPAVSVAVKYLSTRSITYIKLDRIKLKPKLIQKHSSQTIKAAKSHNGLNIYPIANVPPGSWKLTMEVLEGDLLICAIIIC